MQFYAIREPLEKSVSAFSLYNRTKN